MLWEIPMGKSTLNYVEHQFSVNYISLAYFILTLPLTFGFDMFFLSISRKENVSVSKLFVGFKNNQYFRVLGTMLLQTLYIILWAVLFIIPAFIKGIAYSQTLYVLRDNPEFSPNQAIKKSQELMKGHKWEYFVLMLSFIGWGLLALITCGIGFLWLVPYMQTTYALFYQKLIEVEGE